MPFPQLVDESRSQGFGGAAMPGPHREIEDADPVTGASSRLRV